MEVEIVSLDMPEVLRQSHTYDFGFKVKVFNFDKTGSDDLFQTTEDNFQIAMKVSDLDTPGGYDATVDHAAIQSQYRQSIPDGDFIVIEGTGKTFLTQKCVLLHFLIYSLRGWFLSSAGRLTKGESPGLFVRPLVHPKSTSSRQPSDRFLSYTYLAQVSGS